MYYIQLLLFYAKATYITMFASITLDVFAMINKNTENSHNFFMLKQNIELCWLSLRSFVLYSKQPVLFCPKAKQNAILPMIASVMLVVVAMLSKLVIVSLFYSKQDKRLCSLVVLVQLRSITLGSCCYAHNVDYI